MRDPVKDKQVRDFCEKSAPFGYLAVGLTEEGAKSILATQVVVVRGLRPGWN